MEQFKKRQGLSDLVFLEVANEMPAAPRGEMWNFRFCLLNPTFSKKENPVIYRFKQGFGRVCFRHRNKLRGLRARAGSPLHGVLEVFPDKA